MYLATGPRPPYCSAHYLLELELAEPREAERWVQGELMVNLYGERGELTQHALTPGSVMTDSRTLTWDDREQEVELGVQAGPGEVPGPRPGQAGQGLQAGLALDHRLVLAV